MKHYLKVILPMAAIAVSLSLLSRMESSSSMSDLLLQNVEALATNETPVNTDCYGVGSVDCPINSTKVKRVVQSLM